MLNFVQYVVKICHRRMNDILRYFESITHKRRLFKISRIAVGIHTFNKICEIRDEPYDGYNFYPENFGFQFS